MIYISLLVLLTAATLAAAPPLSVDFSGHYTRAYPLEAGQTVEISVGLPSPSKLPANGRVAVEWAGYRKVLHALDPDFYLVYRAPKSGQLTLKVSAVEDEEPIFNLPRWREAGSIQKIERFPKLTPWPAGHRLPLRVHVAPVQLGTSTRGMMIEAEPNDSIADAQTDNSSGSPVATRICTSPAAPTISNTLTTARSASPASIGFGSIFRARNPASSPPI